MSAIDMNHSTMPTRGAYDVPSDGHAHFSMLDIAGFAVATAMLLIPLVMAAYGAWTAPVTL
ncbi:MAG: hypothetical protein CTY25_09430 [Methylobacterium sp.]|nr:MAG: hypothetical protein CTY25_09430 [Methylobacterium sp.]